MCVCLCEYVVVVAAVVAVVVAVVGFLMNIVNCLQISKVMLPF